MDIPNIDYTSIILPNGVRVFMHPTNRFNSVLINVVVESGSLNEEKSENGALHFIEHLVFDGTEDFPDWKSLSDFHNSIAGSGNASTGYKNSKYYGIYPCFYLEKAIYYYSQLVFHPIFSEESIEKERTVILDEIKLHEDSVDEWVYNLVINNRYLSNDTPFSRKVIGTSENIKSFTQDIIKAIYNKYYNPKKVNVFLVGNFLPSDAASIVKKYFYDEVDNSRFLEGIENIYATDFPEYSFAKVATSKKEDTEQIYLEVNFPSFDTMSFSEEDRIKLGICMTALCSSKYPNSVLWSRLREELGLVYDVSALRYDIFSRAIIAINTSFRPELLSNVINEIIDGVEKLKSGHFDKSILEKIVKNIVDTSGMYMDNVSNIMSWIRGAQKEQDNHGKAMSYPEYVEFIKSLKNEDIIDVANRVFDWRRVNFNLVSKIDAEQLKQEVLQIAKAKSLSFDNYDNFNYQW
ncbi:insulinase family protein [Candidatus Dojkabacteria bacterium]|uniref:Insulinase family protein n=1 Tax=Candidatus Dojkabacteria bacterium TaxID=2099670 RepID=A0A3M0Z1V7_9BACT|nr:MAG: insulinase family protein [Candidatus Dojkabacteria bacterium]